MQRTLAALFGAALLITLGGALASRGSGSATGQGSAPVQIVGPLPVPVSGATTVSGTIAATQSGQWNVGITGMPNILVANPAASPVLTRSVDAPGLTPYLAEVQLSDPPNNSTTFCSPPTSCSLWFPAVPAGKRLVVESISGIVGTRITDSLSSVTFMQSGSNSPHGYLGPFSSSTFVVEKMYQFNSAFRSYVEGGHLPVVHVVVGGTTTQGTYGHQKARIVIAGHLLDLP